MARNHHQFHSSLPLPSRWKIKVRLLLADALDRLQLVHGDPRIGETAYAVFAPHVAALLTMHLVVGIRAV